MAHYGIENPQSRGQRDRDIMGVLQAAVLSNTARPAAKAMHRPYILRRNLPFSSAGAFSAQPADRISYTNTPLGNLPLQRVAETLQMAQEAR